MSALTAAYGDRPLEALDGPAVVELAADSWGALAPATWNRHVATLRSFTVFCRRQGWLQVDHCAGLERRPEKTDRTKAAGLRINKSIRDRDLETGLWPAPHQTLRSHGVPTRGHSLQEGARGHGSRATWIPAPQVHSPCHRDRSLIQGMNAERWLDVLADFPTVDEEAESISGTVSLGVNPERV